MKMLAFLANPDRFRRLTGPALPVTGLLAGGLLLVGAIWALGFSPDDKVQGEAVKIMYVHVPAAWMAMATPTMFRTWSRILSTIPRFRA